jgi:hypothetical protein
MAKADENRKAEMAEAVEHLKAAVRLLEVIGEPDLAFQVEEVQGAIEGGIGFIDEDADPSEWEPDGSEFGYEPGI